MPTHPACLSYRQEGSKHTIGKQSGDSYDLTLEVNLLSAWALGLLCSPICDQLLSINPRRSLLLPVFLKGLVSPFKLFPASGLHVGLESQAPALLGVLPPQTWPAFKMSTNPSLAFRPCTPPPGL